MAAPWRGLDGRKRRAAGPSKAGPQSSLASKGGPQSSPPSRTNSIDRWRYPNKVCLMGRENLARRVRARIAPPHKMLWPARRWKDCTREQASQASQVPHIRGLPRTPVESAVPSGPAPSGHPPAGSSLSVSLGCPSRCPVPPRPSPAGVEAVTVTWPTSITPPPWQFQPDRSHRREPRARRRLFSRPHGDAPSARVRARSLNRRVRSRRSRPSLA